MVWQADGRTSKKVDNNEFSFYRMKFDLCISVRDRSQESKVDVEAYFDTGLVSSELFAF